jgi:hypothetical protein
MIQTLAYPTHSSTFTAREFIDQYGDDARYELIDGLRSICWSMASIIKPNFAEMNRSFHPSSPVFQLTLDDLMPRQH